MELGWEWHIVCLRPFPASVMWTTSSIAGQCTHSTHAADQHGTRRSPLQVGRWTAWQDSGRLLVRCRRVNALACQRGRNGRLCDECRASVDAFVLSLLYSRSGSGRQLTISRHAGHVDHLPVPARAVMPCRSWQYSFADSARLLRSERQADGICPACVRTKSR